MVGHTGAGKTTIASLLSRFYDPVEGAILLDGVDLRDLSFKSLRASIGLVLQDNFLFSGTVADNIRYARPEASDEDVIAAAQSGQRARLHHAPAAAVRDRRSSSGPPTCRSDSVS